MTEELFEVVTETGEKIGLAPRSECHGNPSLIHQAVHVLVLNDEGDLFLQKRAANKDIQPGKWDTSVGGHMAPGETPGRAARREMEEELGVTPNDLELAYEYLWKTDIETELIRTFVTRHGGPFTLQASELDDGRFWTGAEIKAAIGTGTFTPNFEVEFAKFQQGFAEKI